MKRSIVFICVVLLVIVGIFLWMEHIHEEVVNIPAIETQNDQEELTQSVCEEAGGVWNNCGSACREFPENTCMQVCVEYCECETSDQCPSGWACGGFVDQVGVCKK